MNIKAAAAVTAVFAFFALASAANAAKVPEKVRIGIYYGSNNISSVNISSDKGMQIGSVKDSKFTPFFNETAQSTLSVKKDSDLHIMIGSSCTDYTAAKAQIDAIKQKGVNAYAAYVDTWQVWTGFYADANSAQADIANLQKKLGNGTYTVIPSDNSRIAASDPSGLTFIFGGISHFNVTPVSDGTLALDKKGYRGDIEVRRLTGSDMTVINSVALDQYLYGVVPSEIEADSNFEALKAQAVAARTYTIDNLGKYAKYDFDLDTTTTCQVYGGISAENPSSNKAVDETKDKFITYNSEPAEVFYFASSGGRTADSKSVWGEEIPYLKSVDDKYEKNHSDWEVTMTAAKIKDTMNSRGFDLGDILNVEVTKTESGIVTELVITGTKDKRVYTLHDCRNVFSFKSQYYTVSTVSTQSTSTAFYAMINNGASQIQVQGKKVMTAKGIVQIDSTASNINVIGKNGIKKAASASQAAPVAFKFSGKGWGHGVGLSQEGAKGMADAGFKYDEILTYYFQGTKVDKLS